MSFCFGTFNQNSVHFIVAESDCLRTQTAIARTYNDDGAGTCNSVVPFFIGNTGSKVNNCIYDSRQQ